ncbi:hypothetical protein BJ322DRAFT_1021507 [Thelephora terrestris]|uniref:Uncharacterized protein n=1 Tax=Thelephora terrestris TaxID=56493 RepID=A0A9P6HBZ7_9AGAM|nr:hypothetical protein BJ322DRAFT_1021507 [Thelephora terrestris]
MPDQDPPEINILVRIRERLMTQHQYSEEQAEARLMATLQTLLEEPDPQPGALPPPRAPPTPPLGDIQRPPKKKATYVDFDQDATIASQIPHYPSEYAVEKIQDIEYVELWYFTTEGCREASKTTPTVADEAFGMKGFPGQNYVYT